MCLWRSLVPCLGRLPPCSALPSAPFSWKKPARKKVLQQNAHRSHFCSWCLSESMWILGIFGNLPHISNWWFQSYCFCFFSFATLRNGSGSSAWNELDTCQFQAKKYEVILLWALTLDVYRRLCTKQYFFHSRENDYWNTRESKERSLSLPNFYSVVSIIQKL